MLVESSGDQDRRLQRKANFDEGGTSPVYFALKRLFAAEAPEGATVTTDHQTEGRGRLGRRWHDAPGRALLCSIVLRPLRPISDWPQLSLLAGEAVAAALPDAPPLRAERMSRVIVDGREGEAPAEHFPKGRLGGNLALPAAAADQTQ